MDLQVNCGCSNKFLQFDLALYYRGAGSQGRHEKAAHKQL